MGEDFRTGNAMTSGMEKSQERDKTETFQRGSTGVSPLPEKKHLQLIQLHFLWDIHLFSLYNNMWKTSIEVYIYIYKKLNMQTGGNDNFPGGGTIY